MGMLVSTLPGVTQQVSAPPTCKSSSAQCLYQKAAYRLDTIAANCQEQKKVVKDMTYRVCKVRGKIVTASESLTEAGDGMGYWFDRGNVVGIRYFHDGTLVTFINGKATTIYLDGGSSIQTKLSTPERQRFESVAKSGYRSIFKQFSN
jgi:hypothetical protein